MIMTALNKVWKSDLFVLHLTILSLFSRMLLLSEAEAAKIWIKWSKTLLLLILLSRPKLHCVCVWVCVYTAGHVYFMLEICFAQHVFKSSCMHFPWICSPCVYIGSISPSSTKLVPCSLPFKSFIQDSCKLIVCLVLGYHAQFVFDVV